MTSHVLPYSAPLCKVLHYSKTGVPWHTKSTFIIKVFLIKCHELPCFAKFYIPSPKDNFLHNVSHYAKQSKMRQNALVSSSQKVVNYKQADCQLFNNIIDKGGKFYSLYSIALLMLPNPSARPLILRVYSP